MITRCCLLACLFVRFHGRGVARLLCERVEEFAAELPPADRAIEFLAWKEHGCRWTESMMTGVVPGDPKRLIPGPSEGQAVRGGHDPDWGRCVRQEELSAHSNHATTEAKSSEKGNIFMQLELTSSTNNAPKRAPHLKQPTYTHTHTHTGTHTHKQTHIQTHTHTNFVDLQIHATRTILF